jgi:predicted DNA-binding protein (MmcQ/YjbR family)
MNAEEIRTHCLTKNMVTESFPFGEHTLVFKVAGKMFLLLSLDSHPLQFNAKCQPDKAIQLREKHAAIIPGYHMNKTHWNTVICDHSVSDALTRELIDNSYDLVVASLPAKVRQNIR